MLICDPNNQTNAFSTTSETEGEVGAIKQVKAPSISLLTFWWFCCGSLVCFKCQSFGEVSLYVCSYYFQFGLGC